MNISSKWFIAVIIVLAVFLVAWKTFLPRDNWGKYDDFPAADADGWQAVFLTNDQVYFGKMENYSREYLALNQIFYLRAADPLQQGTAGPALNLIKLGGELHGPADRMYIPKDKVMFWEDLRNDSAVVTAITDFYARQQ